MGKRAWIIGNAPSIANLDMTRLKDEVTFSFNRAYIAYDDWGWYPTYYVVIDPYVAKQISADVNDLAQSGRIQRIYVGKCAADGIMKHENITFLDIPDADDHWGFCPDRLKYCGDVAAFSLQIAYRLGYTDVILIGVDLDWGMHGATGPDADTDHFRPDYETDRVRMSDPWAHAHLSSWRRSIEQATTEPYNMNITLATPNSELRDRLPYVPFEELLA